MSQSCVISDHTLGVDPTVRGRTWLQIVIIVDGHSSSAKPTAGSMDAGLSIFRRPTGLAWRMTMATGWLDRNSWRLLRWERLSELWH